MNHKTNAGLNTIILRFAIRMLLLGLAASHSFAGRVVADTADRYSMPAVFCPRTFIPCAGSPSRGATQPGWRTISSFRPQARVRGQASMGSWHFMKKTDAVPILAYSYPSRIAPIKCSLRVRNGGKNPVSLLRLGGRMMLGTGRLSSPVRMPRGIAGRADFHRGRYQARPRIRHSHA